MMLDDFPRARRAQRTPPSAVREILKVTERPDVLSFAGGLPAPELFPVEAMARAFDRVLSTNGAAALQYGTTEGFGPLREWIAARLSSRGRRIHADEILMTHGSQQGLDLVSRVLLDPGDVVVVESPSYLAALQVFSTSEANLVTVEADADGVIPSSLARVLETTKPKLIYLIPDFQNPSGARLSMERRHQVLALAAKHNVPILEDDPYGELSFDGPRFPPLHALDDKGIVVHLSTFSKTLAPGLRLGWVAAPKGFLRSIAVAKQACDLQTSTICQRAASTLLETFDYEAHLAKIRAIYGARAKAMQGALVDHFPRGSKWAPPRGGLFLWVGLEEGIDMEALFKKAIEAKVAFVPGHPFLAGPHVPPKTPFMRLNYSHRNEDDIRTGMARLGRVIASM